MITRGATTGSSARTRRGRRCTSSTLRTAEHTLLPMNLLLLYTLLSVANAWSPPYKLLLHSVPPANTINYCVQRVPFVIAKFDPTERHPDRARGGSDKKRGGRGRGRGRGRGGRGGKRSPTAKPAIGDRVKVVEKANYGTDLRTSGVVARVLTRAAQHPRGFKVMLQNGVVGRCTDIEQRAAQESESSSVSDSDAYLAAIRDELPPPGIRLRDVE